MNRQPDETSQMPAITGENPILERILHDVRGDLSRLVHHRRYHQDQSTTSPATTAMPVITATEAPMSLISTLETDAEEVRAKVEEFMKSKLPAATADLKKLEGLAGNPVVLSLLNAIHVPTEALTMAVSVIDHLEELYKPETAAQSPVDTSAPAAPVAVPAEPVAAPVAG